MTWRYSRCLQCCGSLSYFRMRTDVNHFQFQLSSSEHTGFNIQLSTYGFQLAPPITVPYQMNIDYLEFVLRKDRNPSYCFRNQPQQREFFGAAAFVNMFKMRSDLSNHFSVTRPKYIGLLGLNASREIHFPRVTTHMARAMEATQRRKRDDTVGGYARHHCNLPKMLCCHAVRLRQFTRHFIMRCSRRHEKEYLPR